MKILYDKKIPWVKEYFTALASLETNLEANRLRKFDDQLNSQKLKDSQILLTRTTNRIDKQLLDKSKVQIVASATAGTDHIDLSYLRKKNIKFFHSPACNSDAVKEYVLFVVLKYLIEYKSITKPLQVAIIGLGNVGGRLLEVFLALGFVVQVYDPLLSEKRINQIKNRFKAKQKIVFLKKLESIFTDKKTSIITLHVPLTKEGKYPTFKMIDENLLSKIQGKKLLINTSRGEVMDELALLKNINLKKIDFAGDVWWNEPQINLELVKKSFFATPHIAGYSQEAKHQATYFVYKKILNFLVSPSNTFFKIKKDQMLTLKEKTKQTYRKIMMMTNHASMVSIKLEKDVLLMLNKILSQTSGLDQYDRALKEIKARNSVKEIFKQWRNKKYRNQLSAWKISITLSNEEFNKEVEKKLLLEILKILKVLKVKKVSVSNSMKKQS